MAGRCERISALPGSPSTPNQEGCALAINAQPAIEGSALKVAEALAHGRVIVTTIDGARGYDGLESAALIRERRCADMLPPLIRLLTDQTERHARERGARGDIGPWSRGCRSAGLIERITALTGT